MRDATDHALLNRWQRGFPLTARPFADVARDSGTTETEALDRLRRLRDEGVIDRVGPVFRPGGVGASTLAAMAVPASLLENVAAIVNAHPGVNHNYERDHRINLWFVATATDAAALERTLAAIEAQTGLAVLRLPLLEEFHIDLGFDLDTRQAPRGASAAPIARPPAPTESERRLVARVAAGLPLVADPYGELAGELGLTRDAVLGALQRMLDDGRIRRIGAVVRHRKLGFEANAMAVWDVPEDRAGGIGRALAADPAVTLCYRRARTLPDWPYNLYCMVHGRSHAWTVEEVRRLAGEQRLDGYPSATLFSTRCFAQRAARYG